MIPDHPLRFAMSNELHSRPHPAISVQGGAAYVAIKRRHDANRRDVSADREHLIALLDRFGAAHPQPDATHYSGDLGLYKLRWECHTEFVTYTLIASDVIEPPFTDATFEAFPRDWLERAHGERITSILVRIEPEIGERSIFEKSAKWFVPESLAISRVFDQQLTVAGDFRIDGSGHLRFAVFAQPDAGEQHIGRLVQHLCEIETYKSMAMLGFSRARQLNPKMAEIDRSLTSIATDIRGAHKPEEMLSSILDVSAELEGVLAQSSFRFGATVAYDSIVTQRVQALREESLEGVQTIGEFMTRRFDPAVRTVLSTRDRLEKMAERAQRASDLLRTRVDVERSAQNQVLLASMDKRSSLQLRLQKTVEGLSVVATSYYAVGLAHYILAPLKSMYGVPEALISVVVTPLVVFAVWMLIRRIKKSIH